MDHQLRRTTLAERLGDLEVDALFVTGLPNVRYLTGFTGSNGQALVAASGSVFFTDTANHFIRKIDPAGKISTVACRCTVTHAPNAGSFAGDGGPATEALLNWPYGIELDGNKLYIADSYNHRIRVVNL